MAEPAQRPANSADLLGVPKNRRPEVIDGRMVTHLRPAPRRGLARNRAEAHSSRQPTSLLSL